MTPRERTHAALARKPADRVPLFMWFHPGTSKHLSHVLEIPARDVGEAMGNDVVQAWVGNNYAMEGIVHENAGEKHRDFWGIEWVKEGGVNQICKYPLENATDQELPDYRFPEDRIPELVRSMDGLMENHNGFFVGCDISPCVFELMNRIRGMENSMLDLAVRSDASMALLERAGSFSTKLAEKACVTYKLDWLWTGDDVGGQQSLMMSPECWRETIKPHLAKVVQVGKKHNLWVAYHSCGAIRPIIADLIEIGVDVLNPIQVNCPGMDPFDLKKEFGTELAFMGGIDTLELLPRGSADEVCRITEKLLDGMTGDGGGYILGASHTVPPETPIENIFAMCQAAGISREEIFDSAAHIRSRSAERTFILTSNHPYNIVKGVQSCLRRKPTAPNERSNHENYHRQISLRCTVPKSA